ncbi:MAG: cell wall metabolism sensor histidine kinase WalK [Clostridiales bacterium]|nr:cell wall metabolism sensor histidine kinase WalK [Clostridiales bacterium]
MFKTVYSRMLTLVLAIVLGLLIILGVAVSVAFRQFYLDETENRMKLEADEINELVVDRYIDVDKRPSAREEFLVIVRLYDAYIQLCFDSPELGRYSVYCADTGDRWQVAEEADLSEQIRAVQRGHYSECEYGLLTKNTGFYTLTVMRPILTSEGSSLGVIFFHYDMTNVNSSIRRTLSSIALISAIAIVVSVPLVMILVKSITNPISHMTDVVKDFTKGDFSRRVKLKENGKDELHNLGATFNAMADELNTLEAARRSFVANVSHELRSPLTSMRGFLEAMLDSTIPPEDMDTYLGIVLDENRRMTGMVNDLLDLARIESGQYKLTPSVFDMNELIRRTVITFEARIDAKKLGVDVNVGDEPVFAEADYERITQVLHNLVDNAVKYSPERGVLGIECAPEKHIVRVRVQNTGPEIPAEDIPHLFDRFYKAEKAHTPSGTSGTGLGLSIAKLILDQHGQDISVTSHDSLTCFEFTLKRASKPGDKKAR